VIAQSSASKYNWRRTFRRYWMLCKISFQERMEYRWNILMYMVVVLLPMLVTMYLWTAVFNSQSNLAATRNIITYYVAAGFLNWRIADFHWIFMLNIKEGRMANFLLRPMSYPATQFWYEVGGRIWSTILTLPVFGVLILALGDNFQAPNSPAGWLLATLAFGFSFVLNFFLTASLGLITVWQNQPEPFFWLYNNVVRWLGGAMLPLALLPWGLGNWLQWLPFAYIYSLPVRIFQGLPASQMVQGFGVQLFWLATAGLMFRFVWRKAVQRYEVFEG